MAAIKTGKKTRVNPSLAFGFALAAIAVLLCPCSWAQEGEPKVTVVVTPNPVTEGQSLQLRVEVEAAQATVVFQPTFSAPDFILVGSQPNYGGISIRQYVNGQLTSKQKTYYEYILSPKKAGNLSVKNITVKVGDQVLRANDTVVKVLPDDGTAPPPLPTRPNPGFPFPSIFDDEEDDQDPNPAAPNYGGNAGGKFTSPASEPKSYNSDFTVHAVLNKTKAYAGEPIVVEYWLYDFGGLRQIEVQKWPSFSGFWKEDLEITTRFELEEAYANNRPARRAFISRYALYGIRPGKISLDKLVIRGQYVSGSQFQGFFRAQTMRTGIHASQDLTVEILPLPTEGRPPNFSGAVGHFFLKAEADKSSVPQHTPINFTLTLQGTGNFQAVDSIRLPLPPEFEIYESKSAARDSAPIGMRRELESKKTFQITAVPRKAGKFRVEPIVWQYFDPETATYKHLTTEPIEIEVTENAAGAQVQNTYVQSNGPTGGVVLQEEIRPRKTVSGEKQDFGKLLFALAGLLTAVNAWLGFELLKGKVEQRGLFRDRFAEARADLSRAKGAKDGSWLSSLEDALYSLGAVLLGANPRGLTRNDLETQWREKKLPASLFNRIALVLDRLDLNRFSSSKAMDGSQRAKLLQEVEEILKDAGKVKK